jgi:hypothetical protein
MAMIDAIEQTASLGMWINLANFGCGGDSIANATESLAIGGALGGLHLANTDITESLGHPYPRDGARARPPRRGPRRLHAHGVART